MGKLPANTERSRDGNLVFTRYVQTVAAGQEPAPKQFTALWSALRGRLRRELGRRGLWQRPPSFLGVLGHAQWAGPRDHSNQGDALDELVTVCFAFVLVDRIDNLIAHLAAKESIDGLVVRGIRNCVQEQQERHDPMGTRTFKVLQATVTKAVASGTLHIVEGPLRIGGGSMLSFDGRGQVVAPADRVATQVATWNDALMPALVTTTGRGHATLERNLAGCIARLAETGIEAFRFIDILDPLRRDLRGRWTATFQAAYDAGRDETTDDALVSVVRTVAALDDELVQRDTFETLNRCVEDRLRAVVADLATRRLLRAIWRALVAWAAIRPSDPDSATAPLLSPDAIPSRREIGRRLKIPRDRLPTLYRIIGELVEDCRSHLHAPLADTGTPSPAPPPRTAMDLEKRQKALIQQSLEAAARSRRQANNSGHANNSGGQPRPLGSIYTFELGAAPGLDWVLLRAGDNASEPALLVAADTDPQAGPHDVVIPTGSPGGPLTLRCGHIVSIPQLVLDARPTARQIEPHQVAEALAAADRYRLDDLDAEDVEDDQDPDFAGWMAEVTAAAAELRTRHAVQVPPDQAPPDQAPLDRPLPFRANQPEPSRASARSWLMPLAAGLAVCSLGLGLWNGNLRRELKRLSEPRISQTGFDITLFDTHRGVKPMVVPSGVESFNIHLATRTLEVPCSQIRIELGAPDQPTSWSQDIVWDHDGVDVQILSHYLRNGSVNLLRIFDLCKDPPWKLVEVPIEVETEND